MAYDNFILKYVFMFKSKDEKLQIFIFQNTNIMFLNVYLQKVRDAGQRLAKVEALVSSYENGFYIEIPITFDTICSLQRD